MKPLLRAHCLAFSCNSFNGYGPSMTFQEVLRSFSSEGIDVTAFSPRLRRRPDNDVRQVCGLPSAMRYFPWSLVARQGIRETERKLLKAAQARSSESLLYSFPDLSIAAVKEISRLKIPIIREMIGVHRATARRIMIEEHDREGLPPFSGITEQDVIEEREWLEYPQAIFAPNDEVTRSLTEIGIESERILPTSYGWSPARFPLADGPREYDKGLVLLFVGRVSHAKGAHHLLRAWHRAGCPGRLILAGQTEPELERRLSSELAHPSVHRLGFVTDLSPIYAAANAFALPSLFEGGPQVTLEAAAHGLALLVSPMAVARIVDHGQEGLILLPSDEDGWENAIRSFATDLQAVREMGRRARRRAQSFTWELVSASRAKAIKSVLKRASASPENVTFA